MAPRSSHRLKPKPLAEALDKISASTTERVKEANMIFGKIANLLDQEMRVEGPESLTKSQQEAYDAFCTDVENIAKKHFESYMKGNTVPARPQSSPHGPQTTVATAPSPPTLPFSTISPPTTKARTFAKVAREASRLPALKTQKAAITKPIKTQQDLRLFVRMAATHPARDISGHGLLIKLQTELGQKLIKEVLPIKTGFSINPHSLEAAELLREKKSTIEAMISDCKVEEALHLKRPSI